LTGVLILWFFLR